LSHLALAIEENFTEKKIQLSGVFDIDPLGCKKKIFYSHNIYALLGS
jgi:hypothetical protein